MALLRRLLLAAVLLLDDFVTLGAEESAVTHNVAQVEGLGSLGRARAVEVLPEHRILEQEMAGDAQPAVDHKIYNTMKEMLRGSLKSKELTNVSNPLKRPRSKYVRGHGIDIVAEPVPSQQPSGLIDARRRAAHHKHFYREYCYLQTNSDRFTTPPANYALSNTEELIYFEVPKAASTAIRQILNQELQGSRQLMRGAYRLNETELAFFKFTFFRDPIERFVSNFNFLTVFNKQLSADRASQQAAKVASDRWVDELFTKGWWNWHLWPQALYFAMPDGSPRALDLMLPIDELQNGFDIVAQHGHVSSEQRSSHVKTDVIPPFGGRYTQTKVLHTSDLSPESVVRLCRLYLSDYCCFGMDLPPACLEAASRSSGRRFNSTTAVCAHTNIGTLWNSNRAKASSDANDFFAPLPAPSAKPHMYHGANQVVQSYRKAVQKMVH